MGVALVLVAERALGSYQQQKLKLHLQLDHLELNTPNGLKAAAPLLVNEEYTR